MTDIETRKWALEFVARECGGDIAKAITDAGAVLAFLTGTVAKQRARTPWTPEQREAARKRLADAKAAKAKPQTAPVAAIVDTAPPLPPVPRPPPLPFIIAPFEHVARWAAERGLAFNTWADLDAVNEKRAELGAPPFVRPAARATA